MNNKAIPPISQKYKTFNIYQLEPEHFLFREAILKTTKDTYSVFSRPQRFKFGVNR